MHDSILFLANWFEEKISGKPTKLVHTYSYVKEPCMLGIDDIKDVLCEYKDLEFYNE